MAKLKKKGNYVDPNWILEDVTCTGKGWDQNGKKPCYSIWDLDSGVILSREYTRYGEDYPTKYYGFFCPECHCFTELNEKLIPHDVKKNCKMVAMPGSDAYNRLSEEEKRLSDLLC